MSVCCVGFAFIDVAINIMSVPRILVCSSFLICGCMFIVSKYLLISSDTVIVRTGESFSCYGVVNVSSVVTVECCVLYPCCVGVFAVM